MDFRRGEKYRKENGVEKRIFLCLVMGGKPRRKVSLSDSQIFSSQIERKSKGRKLPQCSFTIIPRSEIKKKKKKQKNWERERWSKKKERTRAESSKKKRKRKREREYWRKKKRERMRALEPSKKKKKTRTERERWRKKREWELTTSSKWGRR